jgi:hypothetical protein
LVALFRASVFGVNLWRRLVAFPCQNNKYSLSSLPPPNLSLQRFALRISCSQILLLFLRCMF